MKIQKFGGTSVGSAQRMKEVVKLIGKNESSLVVLSAMAGTTNALIEIADYFARGNRESAAAMIGKLYTKYMCHIDELYSTEKIREKTRTFINDNIFKVLLSYKKSDFTPEMAKEIVSLGEIMSTNMLVNYCNEQGMNAVLLNALVLIYMKTNKYQTPRVLQEVSVLVEESFLAASLVDTAVVTSVGQEVEEYDFTTDEFNHQWEE